MPEITLVIPFRNRETLLPRLLRSLSALTQWPARVVMVDNGSTDGSLSLCNTFAKEHPQRDILIVSEPTPGAPAARNRGLTLCQTAFVYFFDSDDELSPSFFADIAPHLSNDLDLLAVPTRMERNGRLRTRAYRPTTKPEDQILISHVNTQAMVVRADFLRSLGSWDNACPLWNDWELGLRLLLAKPRMRWLTDKTYHTIHLHAESLTGESLAQRADGILTTLVRAANLPLTPTARRALFLRHSILSGQFIHQGAPEAAARSDAQIHQLFGRKPHTLLRTYAAHGGRAAWLLARCCL